MAISYEPKQNKDVDLERVRKLATERFPKTLAHLKESENEDKEIGGSTVSAPQHGDHSPVIGHQNKKATVTVGETTHSFINTTNHGLKVKMPDSVHIFLPGETIEFLPKELGEDGADRELARRARRAEMKSKASMDWAKRNKGK